MGTDVSRRRDGRRPRGTPPSRSRGRALKPARPHAGVTTTCSARWLTEKPIVFQSSRIRSATIAAGAGAPFRESDLPRDPDRPRPGVDRSRRWSVAGALRHRPISRIRRRPTDRADDRRRGRPRRGRPGLGRRHGAGEQAEARVERLAERVQVGHQVEVERDGDRTRPRGSARSARPGRSSAPRPARRRPRSPRQRRRARPRLDRAQHAEAALGRHPAGQHRRQRRLVELQQHPGVRQPAPNVGDVLRARLRRATRSGPGRRPDRAASGRRSAGRARRRASTGRPPAP